MGESPGGGSQNGDEQKKKTITNGKQTHRKKRKGDGERKLSVFRGQGYRLLSLRLTKSRQQSKTIGQRGKKGGKTELTLTDVNKTKKKGRGGTRKIFAERHGKTPPKNTR